MQKLSAIFLMVSYFSIGYASDNKRQKLEPIGDNKPFSEMSHDEMAVTIEQFLKRQELIVKMSNREAAAYFANVALQNDQYLQEQRRKAGKKE